MIKGASEWQKTLALPPKAELSDNNVVYRRGNSPRSVQY